MPVPRHYPRGFQIVHSEGIVLVLDPSSGALSVQQNPGGIDSGRFSWDAQAGRLVIAEWLTDAPVTIRLTPR